MAADYIYIGTQRYVNPLQSISRTNLFEETSSFTFPRLLCVTMSGCLYVCLMAYLSELSCGGVSECSEPRVPVLLPNTRGLPVYFPLLPLVIQINFNSQLSDCL